MYLKKLETSGFKSFADKSDFHFGEGVTGIVGPNGCGKSNVVDAFKWIFGDQSAKSLRGSEMKDVIFNGTQARKPSGFAEVTVVFDNNDRFFKIDFTEVAITRRLYRSGESEYLINRQRCRLKDIKELVMDTGIGTTSYSILEQGKIDVLLQASTLDRRIIFEEAAGISKYRARKAESLRALQRVEENLARMGDVVAELEKQLQRVKAQASKARRFRELSDRLRELRIRLALQDYQASVQEREGISCRRYLLDFQIGRLEELGQRLRRGLEATVGDRYAQGAVLEELRRRLADTRTRRERTSERIVFNRRRLEELQVEILRKEEELRDTDAALVQASAELEREGQEVLGVSGERQDLSARLDSIAGELETGRRRQEECRILVDRFKGAVVARLEERSRLGNSQVQLDSECANLEARKVRLQGQLGQADGELQELLLQEAAARDELQSAGLDAESLETQRVEAEAEAARLEGEIARAAADLQVASGNVSGMFSRLEVLRKFEANFDGVAQGVARLLREGGGGSGDFGLHDLLARLIQVDSRFALAVEAALGAHAQALVVQSQEGALALLRRARDGKLGALEVLPLDRVSAPEPEALLPEPGVLGLLREKVAAAEEHEPLLDALLSRVVLVEDLQTGMALSRNGLRAYRLVTLAGELIEPWGALAIAGEMTTGLISRRSEMRDLERDLAALEGEVASMQAGMSELEKQRSAQAARMEDLRKRREVRILQITALDGRIQQMEKDKERLGRTVRIAASEIGEIDRDLGERAEEKRRIEEALRELEGIRKAAEEDLKNHEELLAQIQEEVDRLGESCTGIKVSLAAVEKREEGLLKSMQQLERGLQERRGRRQSLGGEIETIQGRNRECAGDLEQAESSLAELQAREADEALQTEQAEIEDRKFSEIEDAFRQEIDRIRTLAGAKVTERERANLKDQEGAFKRGNVIEKIRDEYGIDLAEVLANAAVINPATAVPAALDIPSATAVPAALSRANSAAGLAGVVGGSAAEGGNGAAPASPPEAAGAASGASLASGSSAGVDWARFFQDDPSWDRQAAAEEIPILAEKIRRLGNVNLDALDELNEIENRLTFQVAQRDDLKKAQGDLLQIINEINKTSRELFSRTFEQVQKNFSEIFERCFGGGKADLVLEDAADVLDAGIEIVARPPGKKLTSLSLMSGGEKTMTTIALMFAIFKARPSPFCLFDEVDAALDETNVRRFVVLLESFRSSSQFIIITHNKITMSTTDRLYGVTMQEKGVSKRVAVEFEKYDPENPHASLSTADIDEAPVLEGVEKAPE